MAVVKRLLRLNRNFKMHPLSLGLDSKSCFDEFPVESASSGHKTEGPSPAECFKDLTAVDFLKIEIGGSCKKGVRS